MDWAGNKEATHTAGFTVNADLTPPVTTWGGKTYYYRSDMIWGAQSTPPIPLLAADAGDRA